MSATAHKTAPLPDDIRAMKGGTPIVSLTAYTTPMAQMMDGVCDFVLVGDSVGMVLHGLPSTLGVTMQLWPAGSPAPCSWSTCRLALMRKARRRLSAMLPT